MNIKTLLNRRVSFLCRSIEQRDRLCKHLEDAGYTRFGWKNGEDPWKEMLYIVTKGTAFEILPSNRSTWEYSVPIEARSEGEFYKLTGLDYPEQMFTREDMLYFSEYTQQFYRINGQGDPADLFKRKFL